VTEANELYMVMELLEGETLAQYLATRGPLPLPAALSIARQVLLALSEAHAHGIVHRDIKPDNVFLARVRGGDMVAKVMDFGIAGLTHGSLSARLTSTGVAIGTPAYMSPEQAQGRSVDARSDLYSLGVVLFEMLTGKPVFESDTALSLMLRHVSEPPKPLHELGVQVPQQPAVQALLDGLLAKEPDLRPTTRIALLRVEALSGTGESARALSGTQLSAPRSSRALPAAVSVARSLPAVNARMPAPESDPPPRDATYHVPTRTPWQLYALAVLVLGAAGTLALRSLPRLTSQAPERDAVSVVRPASPPPPLNRVAIASTPSGASVLLDGSELGKTPYVFHFQEPTELWLVRRGYERQRVQVEASGPRSVNVALTREPSRSPPRAAGLAVTPPPAEAVVEASPPEPEEPAERTVAIDAPPRVSPPPQPDTAQAIADRFAEYRRSAQAGPDRIEPRGDRPRLESTRRVEPSAEADEAAEAESHERGHGLRVLGRMLVRAVGKVLIPYPDRARREALAGQPLRYLSFRDARHAYDAGELDKVGFQEAVWQLRERRRRAIEDERDRYARGALTQGEYEARVDRVWAEFWGK
jgi:serine/threonine-protein kinase